MENGANHDHAIPATPGVLIQPSPQANDDTKKKFKLALLFRSLLVGPENHFSRIAGYLEQTPSIIDSITIHGCSPNLYEAITKADMEHFASTIASLSHLQELTMYSVSPILVNHIMKYLSDPQNAKARLSKLAVCVSGQNEDEFAALEFFLRCSTNARLKELYISQHEFNSIGITNLSHALKTCTSISSLSLEIPLDDAEEMAESARVVHEALVDYFTNNSTIQQLSLRYVWGHSDELVSALNSMPSLQDLSLVVRMEDQLRGGLLCNSLISNNTLLKKLSIAVFNLHDTFVPQIAQALVNNTTLGSLTLEFGDKTGRDAFEMAPCAHNFLSLQSVLADPANNSDLQHLSLHFSSGVSSDSFESIGNLVGDPNCRLKSLAVELIHLVRPSQVLQLLRNIQDQPTLSQLELEFCCDWDDDEPEEDEAMTFDEEMANIISNLKHLRSLTVSGMFETDTWQGYKRPEELKLLIAQSVTSHKSLEYVKYSDFHNDDLEFACQLNILCAENVASKAARALESLSIEAFPLLFVRAKKACQKLQLPDDSQATVLNNFVKAASVKFSGLTLTSPTANMDWEHAPL